METKKNNWFVRSLIILLILFLVFLIVFSFLNATNPYIISPGIVTLLALTTILILSESYDNLSLGRILSLNREFQQNKIAKEKLSEENNILRNQLIQTIQNELNFKIAQLSSNLNINANGVELQQLIKSLGVVETKSDDTQPISEEELLPDNQNNTIENNGESGSPTDFLTRRKITKALKLEVMNQFLISHQLSSIELKTEVEFSNNFKFVDPIMDRRISFDGYLDFNNKEYFFGVITEDSFVPTDRLYIQLAKILFYKQFKNTDASLILIFSETPESSKIVTRKNRVIEYFQPAISSNLLKIEGVTLCEEEVLKIKNSIITQN